MKYTAIIDQFATESPSYKRVVVMEADTVGCLDALLDRYATMGEGQGITIDDSKKPPRFDESGGFASKLLSFVDENGVDFSNMAIGVFD